MYQKGSNRTFLVEGLINNFAVFSGEKTQSIEKDNESIAISAQWLTSNVSMSYDLPSDNINEVVAFFTGHGLSSLRMESLDLAGASPKQASKQFVLPRGDKVGGIRASVNANGHRFDLYTGSKDFSVTMTNFDLDIPLALNTSEEETVVWHDGSFETVDFAIQAGEIFALGVDVGNQSVYLKQIIFDDLTWSGFAGDYRIVVFDSNGDLRFRSNPISPGNDGVVSWNINWYPLVEDGIFTNTFIAGIEMDSNTGWPEIGFDTNTSGTLSSFYFDGASWYQINDGNYAITLKLQRENGTTFTLSSKNPVIQNFQKMNKLVRNK